MCYGTENDWPKGLLEDYTILLQISLQKYARANEGLVDAQDGHTKYWTYLLHVIVLFMDKINLIPKRW